MAARALNVGCARAKMLAARTLHAQFAAVYCILAAKRGARWKERAPLVPSRFTVLVVLHFARPVERFEFSGALFAGPWENPQRRRKDVRQQSVHAKKALVLIPILLIIIMMIIIISAKILVSKNRLQW